MRTVCRLLLATACAWGLSATTVQATGVWHPSPPDLRQMSAAERDEMLRGFFDDITQRRIEGEQKRRWLRQQWAALSPDERDQLRNQIREHWRHMTPEQRRRLRDVQYSDQPEPEAGGAVPDRPEVRMQRLTPDERQEFRQWMRGRGRGG